MGDGKDSDGCWPFSSDVDYPQNAREEAACRRAARYLVPSMCGGLWLRGLEPRWHSRVICWTFNLFCLLPRPARRCSSPSFPREVISPYRAYVPRLMRSKVVFEYLHATAGLRFSVRDDRQKSRHSRIFAEALDFNFYFARHRHQMLASKYPLFFLDLGCAKTSPQVISRSRNRFVIKPIPCAMR